MAPLPPPTRAPLVGRERELGELAAAGEEASSGRGALFFLVGEAGIGKTRLAEEVALQAGGRGMTVAWGRCWEAGGAPPYWPWIQILRSLDPDAAGLLEGQTHEVAASSTDAERFRTFDGVGRALAAGAAVKPVLLVVEDLHAADPATLRLLGFLGRLLRSARVLVLGTYRPAEARLRPAVSDLLDDCAREGRLLPLRRLEAGEIALLFAEQGLDAGEVERVHRTTEGNPLFVVELLRLLAVERPASGALPIPAGVRAAIRGHLRHVSPPTRAILDVAAVVGREFGVAVLTEASEAEAAALADALDEAVATGVLRLLAPGRYLFGHILIRDALVDELGPPRRAVLHRRVAEALERLHASDPAAPLSEIAHHWLEAGAEGLDRALLVAVAAAERALRQLAFEDGAALAERALAALDAGTPGDGRRRAELLLLLGKAHLLAGAWTEGQSAALRAAELARGLGDAALLARAALTYGMEFRFGVTDRTLVLLLEDALRALPEADGPLRARCLARLAGALQPAPEPEKPVALAWQALDMSDRLGDPPTRLAVLHAGMSALMDYEDPRRRQPLNEELVRRALEAGDRALALRGHGRLVFDALERGDAITFEGRIQDYETAAHEFRQPSYRWPVFFLRAMRAFLGGRFVEGWTLHHEAVRVGAETGDPNAARCTANQACLFFLFEERHDEALACLEEIRRSGDPLAPYVPMLRAGVLARSGRVAETRAAWAGVSDGISAFAVDLQVGPLLAEAAALAGDRVGLESIYARLLPLADRLSHASMAGGAADHPVARGLCFAAWGLGRIDEAKRHHDAAMTVARRLGARPIIARLHLDWACLFGRDAPGEAERRIALARRLGEELGAEHLLALIDRLTGPPGAAAPAPAGPRLPIQIVQEGEYWTVSRGEERCHLKDSRGLHMLARLLAAAGSEVHVLDLAGGVGEAIDGGDAGELLDAEARESYRRRGEALKDELEEAERFHDLARARRAREELDFLGAELARGLGLGGRERRAGRAAERARVNVQRRLSDALRRIQEACPALGRHLSAAVHTGTFCSYRPDEAS